MTNDDLRDRAPGVTAGRRDGFADIAGAWERRAHRWVNVSPDRTPDAVMAKRLSIAMPLPFGTARAAAEALSLRGVRVADELRNPLGDIQVAVERARDNAAWWAGLTAGQRIAMIDTYPHEIGNAEGIWARDRNAANHLVLQDLRDSADQIQSRLDEFDRPNRAERRFLARVNRLDLVLQKARADAMRTGVDGPLILAFDPKANGGRIVLSFGADPYRAESVSWHVPGVRATMHSLLGFHTRGALHHLRSTLQEKPDLSATSIAWIGYDAPSGWSIQHAAGHRLARQGGGVLASDICAFDAARDTWAADGSDFIGNHVFGCSYGSTVTCYAGRDGRLADHVDTITLIGSPGAGPQRHARDFGIGADNVFVASSSADRIAALGGRRPPGPAGRIFGRLGLDPAMESFGAVRISAEFPDVMRQPHTGGTHHAYYLHEPTTDPPIRSESLLNLGRIAAGCASAVHVERHRTAHGWRTAGPAPVRVMLRRGEPDGAPTRE